MSKAIDGEEYMELLKEQYLHHKSIGNGEIAKAWQGAMQLLYDMPTLTPQNEPLACEGCMYAPDCPSEIHCQGCARMYTDHYRRPPERQEDTDA